MSSEHRLRPSARLDQADWLVPRLRDFGSAITSVVPDEFAAYARILHPAVGSYDKRFLWAEVAAKSGRTMHRLVQFHAIDKSPPVISEYGPMSNPAPDTGNLAPDLLRALCEVLAGHTGTAQSCWFCLWRGYSWMFEEQRAAGITFYPAGDPGDPFPPRPCVPVPHLRGQEVELPGRNYFLYEGPVDAATELGWWFGPQSPNLFWPQDHLWCVASEIDLYCTLVGGSEALIEELVADSRFEAWRVYRDDPISSDSDKINV